MYFNGVQLPTLILIIPNTDLIDYIMYSYQWCPDTQAKGKDSLLWERALWCCETLSLCWWSAGRCSLDFNSRISRGTPGLCVCVCVCHLLKGLNTMYMWINFFTISKLGRLKGQNHPPPPPFPISVSHPPLSYTNWNSFCGTWSVLWLSVNLHVLYAVFGKMLVPLHIHTHNNYIHTQLSSNAMHMHAAPTTCIHS